MTEAGCHVNVRIGAPPPGPRRRNWVDGLADVAMVVLLGCWLAPVIGGWS